MLRRERSLWPWVLVPFALNLRRVRAGGGGVRREPRRARGPARAHARRGRRPSTGTATCGRGRSGCSPRWCGWCCWSAFGVAIYFAFTAIGGVIAAPFLDVLSERVERLARGAAPPQAPDVAAVLRRAGRSVIEEGKRVAFLLALQRALLAIGLVPGLQPFAARREPRGRGAVPAARLHRLRARPARRALRGAAALGRAPSVRDALVRRLRARALPGARALVPVPALAGDRRERCSCSSSGPEIASRG